MSKLFDALQGVEAVAAALAKMDAAVTAAIGGQAQLRQDAINLGLAFKAAPVWKDVAGRPGAIEASVLELFNGRDVAENSEAVMKSNIRTAIAAGSAGVTNQAIDDKFEAVKAEAKKRGEAAPHRANTTKKMLVNAKASKTGAALGPVADYLKPASASASASGTTPDVGGGIVAKFEALLENKFAPGGFQEASDTIKRLEAMLVGARNKAKLSEAA